LSKEKAKFEQRNVVDRPLRIAVQPVRVVWILAPFAKAVAGASVERLGISTNAERKKLN
jgi:hypothetical protein